MNGVNCVCTFLRSDKLPAGRKKTKQDRIAIPYPPPPEHGYIQSVRFVQVKMSRYRRYSTIHCSWRSTARRWLSHPVKPFHLFFFEKLLPLPWHGADTPTGENTRYDEWHWPLHSGPVATMGERKKKGGYCVYHYTLHPSCGGCPVKVKREKVNSLYYVDFMRYYVEERGRERIPRALDRRQPKWTNFSTIPTRQPPETQRPSPRVIVITHGRVVVVVTFIRSISVSTYRDGPKNIFPKFRGADSALNQ